MDINSLTAYFTQYGAIAIFVIVFLEYLNLPGFPAGVIMPLAGVMAAKGNIGFTEVMILTVSAGLLGSLVLYALGRTGGNVFLKTYIHYFPKQKGTIEKNLEWIRQRGSIGVFLAKLIPMFRTVVSIPAGLIRMNLRKYVISSTLGIVIWNFFFVGAGYVLGEQVLSLWNRM